MDKAPDFGSGDCRFESCHDRYFLALDIPILCFIHRVTWHGLSRRACISHKTRTVRKKKKIRILQDIQLTGMSEPKYIKTSEWQCWCYRKTKFAHVTLDKISKKKKKKNIVQVVFCTFCNVPMILMFVSCTVGYLWPFLMQFCSEAESFPAGPAFQDRLIPSQMSNGCVA